MKFIYLFSICMILSLSCCKDDETKKLTLFFDSFNINLKDYKIVCFVPADGCSSCIDPALNYLMQGNKNYLLVLSSIYTKSIDEIIEFKRINRSKIIVDDQNLAASLGFVPFVAPSFYFLKNGQVIKIIDTSETTDKKSVILEVDKFLSK